MNTADRRQEILSEINRRVALNRDVVVQTGLGVDRVRIALTTSGLDLAQELRKSYGDNLHIEVGFKTYPDGELVSPRPLRSRDVGVKPESIKVRARFTLDSDVIVDGSFVTGTLRLHNQGLLPFRCLGRTHTVRLTRHSDGLVVGGWTLSSAASAMAVAVQPRNHIDMAVVVGTASLEETSDFTTGPGEYGLLCVVGIEIEHNDGEIEQLDLRCTGGPVVVVPA